MNAEKMSVREVVDGLDREEVVAGLEQWVGCERDATALVVGHLAVMERDRIHVEMGYASLYSYCRERLGYSHNAALKRIRAARAALRHPEILDHLETGALTLSAIKILARHLTGGEVGVQLLAAARDKTCREIEALVAARFPTARSPRGDLRIKAAGPGLVRVEMVVTAEVGEKLTIARELDRQESSTGDIDSVLSRALDQFIADLTEGRPEAPAREDVRSPEPETADREASLGDGKRTITRHNLVRAMKTLGYSNSEARYRASYALEKIGFDATLESLCLVALGAARISKRASS